MWTPWGAVVLCSGCADSQALLPPAQTTRLSYVKFSHHKLLLYMALPLTQVVDLSADFRLRNVDTYAEWCAYAL